MPPTVYTSGMRLDSEDGLLVFDFSLARQPRWMRQAWSDPISHRCRRHDHRRVGLRRLRQLTLQKSARWNSGGTSIHLALVFITVLELQSCGSNRKSNLGIPVRQESRNHQVSRRLGYCFAVGRERICPPEGICGIEEFVGRREFDLIASTKRNQQPAEESLPLPCIERAKAVDGSDQPPGAQAVLAV